MELRKKVPFSAIIYIAMEDLLIYAKYSMMPFCRVMAIFPVCFGFFPPLGESDAQGIASAAPHLRPAASVEAPEPVHPRCRFGSPWQNPAYPSRPCTKFTATPT